MKGKMSSWFWVNFDFLIRTCFEVPPDEEPNVKKKQPKNYVNTSDVSLKNTKYFNDLKLNYQNSPTEKTEYASTVTVGESGSSGSVKSNFGAKNDDIASIMDTSRSRHQRKSTQDALLKQKGLEIHGVLASGRFGSFLLARRQKEAAVDVKHEYVSLTSYHKSVLDDTYQQHVPLREMKLLKSFDHPMITSVLGTFSDRNCLYVMSPLEIGGPLSHLLQNALTLGITDDVKNFYAACVVSVLKYAHSQDIIHRGIHPDSLLIDGSGYLKVTDWGFAKHVVDRTYTLCGHVEYLCPEAIFHDSGYAKGADYWALGVLIYEMYVGRSAFAPGSLDFKYDGKFDDRVVISTGTEASSNYMTPQKEMSQIQESLSSTSLTGIDRTSSPALSEGFNKKSKGLNDQYELKDASDHDDCTIQNILTREPVFPSYMPHPTKSIIQGLCQKNVTQRLGTRRGGKGVEDILRHIFFQDIQWTRLNKKLETAPWVPSAAVTLGLESSASLKSEYVKHVKHYPSFVEKTAASRTALCGPAFEGYNCPEWNSFV